MPMDGCQLQALSLYDGVVDYVVKDYRGLVGLLCLVLFDFFVLAWKDSSSLSAIVHFFFCFYISCLL